MGGKLSKKKKGYDVSDPKEKPDGDTKNTPDETESEAQPTKEAARAGGPEEPATETNSTEPTGEASAVSQEVVSSQNPAREAVTVDANETQEKMAAVTGEPVLSASAQTKPEEPSSGSESQVSLPAVEAPAVKKSEEPNVAETEVTPSPQATEPQVIQENLAHEFQARPPITDPESVTSVQVEEAAAEKAVVVQESTTQSETDILSEQFTAVTEEEAEELKPTKESETAIPKEPTITEMVVPSPVQESNTKSATTILSDQDTTKMEVNTSSESETVHPPEQVSIETVKITAVQESANELETVQVAFETEQETVICKTPESLANPAQKLVTQTETPEPNQVPPPIPEKLPEVITDDGKTADFTEAQEQPGSEDKSIESHASSQHENVESSPSSQPDVPSIGLNSEKTEAVPEIVISESLSTNEFPGDEVEENVAMREEAMKSPVRGHNQEPVVPEVNTETEVGANEEVPTSENGTTLVEENGECETTASAGEETGSPTPELNGTILTMKTVVEKQQEEECINGTSSPEGTPKEDHIINDCDFKKDFVEGIEDPAVIGDMAQAISTTNEIDLI